LTASQQRRTLGWEHSLMEAGREVTEAMLRRLKNWVQASREWKREREARDYGSL